MRRVITAVIVRQHWGPMEANVVAVEFVPFEIECTIQSGEVVRADVYRPAEPAASRCCWVIPYQKALRYLPVAPTVFQFI